MKRAEVGKVVAHQIRKKLMSGLYLGSKVGWQKQSVAY
jgi:hypothetical protein